FANFHSPHRAAAVTQLTYRHVRRFAPSYGAHKRPTGDVINGAGRSREAAMFSGNQRRAGANPAHLVTGRPGRWGAAGLALALQLCVVGTARAAKDAGRDWAKYPAIAEVEAKDEIFAIGDVHGDYDRLIKLLKGGKVIAEAP